MKSFECKHKSGFVGSAYLHPILFASHYNSCVLASAKYPSHKVWQHLVNIDWWEFVIYPSDIIFYIIDIYIFFISLRYNANTKFSKHWHSQAEIELI